MKQRPPRGSGKVSFHPVSRRRRLHCTPRFSTGLLPPEGSMLPLFGGASGQIMPAPPPAPPPPPPLPGGSPLAASSSLRQLSHVSTHGCMDPSATNFDNTATSFCCCVYGVPGCTDSTAINYAAHANTDDSSCVARVYGCMDGTATNYNPGANSNEPSWCTYPYVDGCTYNQALNYNSDATRDDGSCVRPPRPALPAPAISWPPSP